MDTPYPMYNKWIPLNKTIDITITAIIIKICLKLIFLSFHSFTGFTNTTWDQSDPVDEWECERAKRIENIQGNRNEVVLNNC